VSLSSVVDMHFQSRRQHGNYASSASSCNILTSR